MGSGNIQLDLVPSVCRFVEELVKAGGDVTFLQRPTPYNDRCLFSISDTAHTTVR